MGFTGLNLEFIADLELVGLELEATYRTDNIEILANHSYLKSTDFMMSEELKTGRIRNNISFADYFYNTRGDVPIQLTGFGSGINNWSENTSKFVYTQRFLDDAVRLQVNAQIYWDYEGSYDEMRMYERAYDQFDVTTLNNAELIAFERQRDIFERERELIEREGAYERQINVGASLTYLHNLESDKQLRVTVTAQNLLKSRYRYYVSTGSSSFYPNRLSFMREPVTFGLRVDLIY